MNKRITPKERNLLKGAIRRVFSRSELRRRVLELSIIKHEDLSRPRVKKWSRCPICTNPTPTYLMQVDHQDPVIPVVTKLEDMSWDTVVDRTWCEENNLKAICKQCHDIKTKAERKLRTKNKKKERNKNE